MSISAQVNQRVKQDFRLAIILFLGLFASLLITPFAIYRAIEGHVLHTLVDLGIVISITACVTLAAITNQTLKIGYFMAVVCVFGASLTSTLIGFKGIFWLYPAIIASMFISTPLFGLSVSLFAISFVHGMVTEEINVTSITSIATMIMVTFFTFAISLRQNTQAKMLQNRADSDALTGTKNRYAMDDLCAESIAWVSRHKIDYSVIMLDIDHFKRINDTLGHDAGDQIIKQVARIIEGSVRQTDNVCRFGGEEFTIFLPKCNLLNAVKIAEKIRQSICFSLRANGDPVTVSCGCTEIKPSDNARKIIERADRMLYIAKQNGRNRTIPKLRKR